MFFFLSLTGEPIELLSLGPANSTLTFHPNPQSEAAASLAIDGVSPNGTSIPLKSQCPGTGYSYNRWIRIDMKGLYSVHSVSVSSRGYSGDGVTVHVGNSLINDGVDNFQCGDVWSYSNSSSPYFKGAFQEFVCFLSLWAQYVTIRGGPQSNDSLEICEVQVSITLSGRNVFSLHMYLSMVRC